MWRCVTEAHGPRSHRVTGHNKHGKCNKGAVTRGDWRTGECLSHEGGRGKRREAVFGTCLPLSHVPSLSLSLSVCQLDGRREGWPWWWGDCGRGLLRQMCVLLQRCNSSYLRVKTEMNRDSMSGWVNYRNSHILRNIVCVLPKMFLVKHISSAKIWGELRNNINPNNPMETNVNGNTTAMQLNPWQPWKQHLEYVLSLHASPWCPSLFPFEGTKPPERWTHSVLANAVKSVSCAVSVWRHGPSAKPPPFIRRLERYTLPFREH